MRVLTVRYGLGVLAVVSLVGAVQAAPPPPSTFSIAAADPEAGEVGVAVASRFFAVGTVVPWARAGVGAVATQANANTSFGPHGLELLTQSLTPEETVQILLRTDTGNNARQVGIVSANGDSATYSGPGCTPWAGGRHGPGYAVQGNILAGEKVVAAMEAAFLASTGKPLAERLYAALKAGDEAGGDSRGKQSAAILVCRARAGYNGFTDHAVDIRVDDSPEPFVEIGRLLGLAMVNDSWNQGWTAFTEKRFPEALAWQERAAARAEAQPGMLPEVLYDLAVIRLANGDRPGSLTAAKRAIKLNPRLATQARQDSDLAALRGELP
jgi:uncharacterized Ntn-hydrolase superfamily protein